MKTFENKVRWDFRIAIAGYGRNVKEALIFATKNMAEDLEDNFGYSSEELAMIERHEVVSISEGDILEEDE